MNVWTATGRLTADPELRHVGQQGTALMAFRLAFNTLEKKDGAYKDKGNFISCKMWGERVERIIDWLSKGSPVAISGELQMEEWADKNTGEQKQMFVCNVKTLELLESKAQREARQGGSSSSGSSGGWDPDKGSSDDDLPF